MTHIRNLLTVALAYTSLLLPASAQAAKIDKVLPFTGLDHLRARMTFSAGETKGEVEFAGRILPEKASDDNKPLWEGTLGKVRMTAGKTLTKEFTVENLKPALWTPADPNLYTLVVEARHKGEVLDTATIRFGFRTMESRDGKMWLNGKPIFLRGIAINPPGRGVPPEVGTSRKFAEDYVRFMRAHNVNIIRLEPESDVWLDVCDELGMMIYQGVYGSPPGHANKKDQGKNKVPPLEASLTEYRKVFDNYVAHPSVVIYVLSNELPYEGKRGQEWHAFLTKAHAVLKPEYTQPFIGNAGYGQGREGDINDVHRYWGWYYNSHLTFFNLRNPTLFGDPAKALSQPLTFSECVGSFTGPSGQVNSIFRKQLGAQLNWTGHADDQVGEMQSYQAYVFKHIAESFRTLRPANERISGLMPFTILFRNWRGIESFDQMGHNANADQMTVSYAPILLSWEQWTPNVYAGTTVKAIAHVVNDAEDFRDLKNLSLSYEVVDAAGQTVVKAQTRELPAVAYYGTTSTPVEIALPADLPTGAYTVRGSLGEESKPVAANTVELFVAGTDWPEGGAKPAGGAGVRLYDPAGKTAQAFKQLGIPFKLIKDVANASDKSPLVIGEGVWDNTLTAAGKKLRAHVAAGGRVLVMGQPREKFKTGWLPSAVIFNTQSNNDPTYEKRTRPMSDGMHVNPQRPWHPALAGVSRDNLKWWSDYTAWDQTQAGFPDIYPVGFGFRLTDAKDLAHTAIIANYDRGLEAIALAEMFDGEGSVLMTSFRLVPRVGQDPVADRMLRNIVAHLTSSEGHEVHPLVEAPIKWGNYPTERGVVVEPLGGLVVNCRWQVPPTDPGATPLPDNEGAWNTKPGDGYVPFGRRVFGPWSYTNATGIRDLSDPAQAAMMKRQQAGEAGTAAINPPAAELDDVDNAPQKKKAGASETGYGQFWARVPAGRQWAVTQVENPSDKPGRLEVRVNEGEKVSVEVGPGQTATVKAPFASGAAVVNVRFIADKTLVLLETWFE